MASQGDWDGYNFCKAIIKEGKLADVAIKKNQLCHNLVAVATTTWILTWILTFVEGKKKDRL